MKSKRTDARRPVTKTPVSAGIARWFWYVARPNEIFVDLDSPRAVTRALSVLRRALNVKKNAKSPLNKLDIESVWLYPTETEGHSHLIVVLKYELRVHYRLAWSLWMGTDQIRAAYVLERFRYFFNSESSPVELFCARQEYGFRKPDTFCFCKEKHKKKHVTDQCDALARILGNHRSDDYFPRNRDTKERKPVRFAPGKIALTRLRAWK
jgi:hypothetical protein